MADGKKTTYTLGRETGDSIPLRKLRALFDEKKSEEASFRAYWSYGPPHTRKTSTTLTLASVFGVLLASAVVAMLIAPKLDAPASLLLDGFSSITLLALPVLLMLMLIHSEVENWQLRRLKGYYRKAHLSSDAYEKALRLLPDDPAYAEAFHTLVAERLERRSARPLPSLDTAERTERWVNWVLNPLFFMSMLCSGVTGMTVLTSLDALWDWRANSRTVDWQPAPARIIIFDPSQCTRGERTKGIHYQYEWQGRTYFSKRFAGSGGNSTLHDCGREAIETVSQDWKWDYTTDPPQRRVTAYVNPNDPWSAVLMRGTEPFQPEYLLSLLFVPSLLLMWWTGSSADKLTKEKGFD